MVTDIYIPSDAVLSTVSKYSNIYTMTLFSCGDFDEKLLRNLGGFLLPS